MNCCEQNLPTVHTVIKKGGSKLDEKKVVEMLAEKRAELDDLLKVLHPDVDKASVVASKSMLREMSKQDIFNRVETFGIDMTIQANDDSEFMRDLVVEDRFKVLMSDDVSDNDSLTGLLIDVLRTHLEEHAGVFGLTKDGVIKHCINGHLHQQLREMSEGGLADVFYRDVLKKMKSQFGRLLELHKDIEFMENPKERLVGRLIDISNSADDGTELLKLISELAWKHTVNLKPQEMIDKTDELGGDGLGELETEYCRVIVEHASNEETLEDTKKFRDDFIREVVDKFDDVNVSGWLIKLG